MYIYIYSYGETRSHWLSPLHTRIESHDAGIVHEKSQKIPRSYRTCHDFCGRRRLTKERRHVIDVVRASTWHYIQHHVSFTGVYIYNKKTELLVDGTN
jgi:hypothetical protein